MILRKSETISLKRKLCFFVPLFLVIALASVNVLFSGQFVSQGQKIHTLETQAGALALQQKDLETTLASTQSLQNIKADAMAQGYVPVSAVAVVDGTRQVALRP
ncbi:MAG TPA: hypothetical protein VFG51_03785 [Candidatus Saccharimonadia bacterium]|nr:hypothetical protein [Candidatus Saccharimonadia bacterium]